MIKEKGVSEIMKELKDLIKRVKRLMPSYRGRGPKPKGEDGLLSVLLLSAYAEGVQKGLKMALRAIAEMDEENLDLLLDESEERKKRLRFDILKKGGNNESR